MFKYKTVIKIDINPAPRPTSTKEKEVKYYDYCDLIHNIIAGLATAIAAVTNNNDNCFERGEREREYDKGLSISHPTPRPAPAKERDVECCYCCDLICDLSIAGLTAPATTVTVKTEFDNNIIRGGFTFAIGVSIITTELYPLNMDT